MSKPVAVVLAGGNFTDSREVPSAWTRSSASDVPVGGGFCQKSPAKTMRTPPNGTLGSLSSQRRSLSDLTEVAGERLPERAELLLRPMWLPVQAREVDAEEAAECRGAERC